MFSIKVKKIRKTVDSWMFLPKFLLIKSLNTLNGTLGKGPWSDDAQTAGESSNIIMNHTNPVILIDKVQKAVENHNKIKFLEIQVHLNN